MPTIPVFVYSFSRSNGQIQQDLHIKGIELLGKKLRLSEYADDMNFFCADVASVEVTKIANKSGPMEGT